MTAVQLSYTLKLEYFTVLKRAGLAPATIARIANEKAAEKILRKEAVELLNEPGVQE